MFKLFKKKKPAAPPPDDPPPALGWEAIEKAFGAVYPDQRPAWWEHRGVHAMYDLKTPPENPLEAVAIYDGGTFWHYVSFGLSDLFGQRPDAEWSGYGYELTFRLAKDGPAALARPLWPVDALVSLARAQYAGSDFGVGHTIQTGPIDGRPETTRTAFLTVDDPAFDEPVLETPHGKLSFFLLVGIEGSDRAEALETGVPEKVAELRARDPELVTRLP